MKRVTLAPFLLCALAPAAARAQAAAPVVVSLEYSAPEDCPDAAGFRAQVRGRTARVAFGSADESPELGWSVTITETANGSRGALRVNGTASGKLERNVTAASCQQVVSALALVAALSVDPEASLAARAEPAPAPATKPPPPAPAAPQPKAAPSRNATSESKQSRTQLALGLTLSGQSGIAPRLAWAPRPFVNVSFRSRSGYTWGIGLSATQAHGHASSSSGQADFTWSLARVEAFPIRASFGRFRLEPALFVEMGQLRARGVGVTPVAQVRRPAFNAGGLARLSFLAFDLLLLEVEGGPLVPLTRDRFYLFENTTIFRIPALTGFVAVGVGLEFS